MTRFFSQRQKKIDALVEFTRHLTPFSHGRGLVLTFAGSEVVDSLAKAFPTIKFIAGPSGPDKQNRHNPLDADCASFDPEDLLAPTDMRYDLIVLYDWLEYCRWPRWALQKIEPFCSPNGVLIVAVGKKNVAGQSFFLLRRTMRSMGFELLIHEGHGLINLRPNSDFFARSKSLTARLDRFWQGFILNFFTGFYLAAARKNKERLRLLKDRLFESSEKPSEFELLYPQWIKGLQEWLFVNPRFVEKPLEIDPAQFASKTILVLSPHPDDETIGCGGTIVRLRRAGANVVILQMTDGTLTKALTAVKPPVASGVRLDESRQAAERLGVNEPVVWGLEQRSFACSPATIEKMTELLDHLQPDMIFTPFVNDPHPDHITANKILQASLKKTGYDVSRLTILNYEVWSLVPANRFCTLGEEFDDKCAALMLYQTAMKALDYVEFCARLNVYESHLLRKQRGFAEAFLETDVQTYLTLDAGGSTEQNPTAD